MPKPRPSSLGLEALGGGLSVAAALVLLARWLPLRFAFQPNDQGIVGLTIQQAYPTQQEPLLFLGFGALGVLALWGLAGWLGSRRFPTVDRLGFEALSLLALASALFLPRGAATGAAGLAFLGLGLLARRSSALGAKEDPGPAAEPGGPPVDDPDPDTGSRGIGWGLGLGILALAIVRSPRLFQGISALNTDASDLDLTRNDWVFLSEDGQHLAWADALLQGGLHGRDFFCLYGPLYDWSVVWVWKLFGRSIAGWHLHVGITEVLAWVAFLSLASLMLKRRWLLLPLALLTPHLMLRVGLALGSLLFLFRHGRNGRTSEALAAGAVGGLALLYSQEFGLAAVIGAGTLLLLPPAGRALGAYAAGLALTVMPLLGWYAAAGALAPMLSDLAGYPALLMAGFGNIPFPSLRSALPFPIPRGALGQTALFYAIPATLVIALGMNLPRAPLDLRNPIRWGRALIVAWAADPRGRELAVLALFGLAAFRSALGRSDVLHLYIVAGPAILLLAVGTDRLLDRWRSPGVRGELGLALALVFLAGFVTGPGRAGLYHFRGTATFLRQVTTGAEQGPGNGAVRRVVSWLEENSEPEDRFYFLPNEAALYYLTGRPAPTRFVVGHQMVTDTHRREALEDLAAAPPRYVIWNDASLELDGYGHEVWLGSELWDWLHASYEPRVRAGGMRIWERKPAGSAAAN